MFLENDGYCSICMQVSRFESLEPWLRDHYICTRCRSIPRRRALVEVLNFVQPDWRRLVIHESSPSLIVIGEQATDVTFSFFFEDVKPGERNAGGYLCEDIEHLTFEDETFDIFITQDVMEHVCHPEMALREISRVLRPGGHHVFTTPKHKTI